MKTTRERFGVTRDGQPVDRVTLTNARGAAVRVLTYGGIVQSLTVPDRDGAFGDVVLGYDSLAEYERSSPYFGALIGRVANRTARGRFVLDGMAYRLATNDGPHHLHGGMRGFDKVVWNAAPFARTDSAGVTLTHESPDGDEGYPGDLHVGVTYTLTDDCALRIEYRATTTRATPVNLTHHSYFNLSGGSRDILAHELTIAADAFTPVDTTLIPTGIIAPVDGTPFDFRRASPIGARIAVDDEQLRHGGGYDHNFVLRPRERPLESPAAIVVEPERGRTLTVFTTEPGLQFYSGNFLDGTLRGSRGRVYGHRHGFCLETQHFPDAMHHPSFPSTILHPGETLTSTTIYRFGVRTA